MDAIKRRAELKEEFERQADWRWGKAVEDPHDTHDAEAAQLFDKLAGSVEDCPEEVILALWELFDEPSDSEGWKEKLRSVGFHSWPSSAEELCREFIAQCTATSPRCVRA